jgi:hypothetical protein
MCFENYGPELGVCEVNENAYACVVTHVCELSFGTELFWKHHHQYEYTRK